MAWNEPGDNSNNNDRDPWEAAAVVVAAVVTARGRPTWMRLSASFRTA